MGHFWNTSGHFWDILGTLWAHFGHTSLMVTIWGRFGT